VCPFCQGRVEFKEDIVKNYRPGEAVTVTKKRVVRGDVKKIGGEK
jgi:hypothetical protein